MFALLTKKFTKKPKTSSAFSEFMRNASAREQKRVFKKVIEESISGVVIYTTIRAQVDIIKFVQKLVLH